MLADDRPGHAAQAIGVAEALGLPFTTHALAFSRWARPLGLVRSASVGGLTGDARASLVPPWPDLVIAAGRRTVPVARWIKSQSGGAARLVQLMSPGRLDGFDLVAVPEHDRPRADPRIVTTRGAPHRIHATTLEAARAAWAERLQPFPAPRIVVLVGGPSANANWPTDWPTRLVDAALALRAGTGGSLLVTTSRRTPAEAVAVLRERLTPPCHVHAWGEPNNPYQGFLAWADAILVTADSASMLTEACATGRPVHVFGEDAVQAGKFRHLLDALRADGRIRPATPPLGREPQRPLRPQDDVAAAIRSRGLVDS